MIHFLKANRRMAWIAGLCLLQQVAFLVAATVYYDVILLGMWSSPFITEDYVVWYLQREKAFPYEDALTWWAFTLSTAIWIGMMISNAFVSRQHYFQGKELIKMKRVRILVAAVMVLVIFLLWVFAEHTRLYVMFLPSEFLSLLVLWMMLRIAKGNSFIME